MNNNNSNLESSSNASSESSISSTSSGIEGNSKPNIDEIINKFEEFEKSMKNGLPKVDPRLIRDILHRRKNDPYPMYTLEIFLEGKYDTDELKKVIMRHLGVMPAFYDNGTHVVVAHRFNLQMLDTVSHYPHVEKIRGTFAGAGRGASIGPVFERNDKEDYFYTSTPTTS